MKKALASLFTITALSAVALADINDPPMNDQGPTRKLGRGIANLAFGWAEIPTNIGEINHREGNASAVTVGVVKGVGRTIARARYGFYEVLTFPFPTTWQSYRPPYKSNVPWIHGGYEEFPPELGFESKRQYCRSYNGF